LIPVDFAEINVITYIIEKYIVSFLWYEDCEPGSGSGEMNLLSAVYKILVWVARSVTLILAVLLLGVLLRFSGKR
jgi:hypothetical protein